MKYLGLLSERVEHTGKDGGPIQIEDKTPLSDFERARRLAFILTSGEEARDQLNRANGAAPPEGEPPRQVVPDGGFRKLPTS